MPRFDFEHFEVNPFGDEDPLVGYPKRFTVRNSIGDLVEYEVTGPGAKPKLVTSSESVETLDPISQKLRDIKFGGSNLIQNIVEGSETQDIIDPVSEQPDLTRIRGIVPLLEAGMNPASAAYGPEVFREASKTIFGGEPESPLGSIGQASLEKVFELGASPLTMLPTVGKTGAGVFGALAAKQGGENLGEAIARAEETDWSDPEAVRKATLGVIDLILAPVMLSHAAKGLGSKAPTSLQKEVVWEAPEVKSSERSFEGLETIEPYENTSTFKEAVKEKPPNPIDIINQILERNEPRLEEVEPISGKTFREVLESAKNSEVLNEPEYLEAGDILPEERVAAADKYSKYYEVKPLVDKSLETVKDILAPESKLPGGREAGVIDFGGKPKPEPESKVVSQEANILRKTLQKLKVREFDLETLPQKAEELGVSLFQTEEYKPRLAELVNELKDSGWVKEKIGGKYEIMTIPPEKFSAWKASKEGQGTWIEPIVGEEKYSNYVREKIKNGANPKEQSTEFREQNLLNRYNDGIISLDQLEKGYTQIGKALPEEAKIAKIKEIVEETLPAEEKLTPEEFANKYKELPKDQKASLEKVVGATRKRKPSIPIEGGTTPSTKEKVPSKAYTVTLSDGSEHTIIGKSPEQIKVKVENLLIEHNSTKTIDKIEPKLTSLEKSAKFEIDPLKQGMEEVSDITGLTKKETRARELAHEKELIDQLKVEESFTKTTQKAKAKDAKARERELAKEREKATGGFINNPIVRVASATKSLAFGGDVGHFLRQGKQMTADLLFSSHWRKAFQQFKLARRLAMSEEEFTNLHEQLYSDPKVKLLVDKFNLDMPGLGKGLKEEVFHGGELAEKIPLIGKYYVKPSERVYTGGLNFLRAAEAVKFVENLEKQGFTPENAPEKYRAVAAAINIIGQRGDFNPAYTKVLSDASAFYGAPRAKMARLQNAWTLFQAGERGDIVRLTAAKTLAFNAIVYGTLLATTGGEFITDPKRSDFLKIRLNDKITIDPWMGLGVTARTIGKLYAGESKSPYTGKTRPLPAKDALTDEFLGGLAPAVHLVYQLWSGKDLRGYQVGDWEGLLNVTPLTARNIYELVQAGDIEEAIVLSVLQFGGEGVDVFDYKKAQEKEKRLKKERKLGSSRSRNRQQINDYFPVQ